MRKQRLKRLMTWNERAKDKRGWVIVTPNYLRMKVKTNMYGNYVYDDNGKKVVEPVREGLFDLLKIPWEPSLSMRVTKPLPVRQAISSVNPPSGRD